MSRVGNRILTIPEKVSLTQDGTLLTIEGPLGKLQRNISPLIALKVENNQISTIRANEEKIYKTITWNN